MLRAADVKAAGIVDLLGRELVALLEVGARCAERSGERQDRADKP